MKTLPRTKAILDKAFKRSAGFSLRDEINQLETELNEARAEVERLKAKANAEINENLQHLADLRGYEELEMPAKDQLIEKLAGALRNMKIAYVELVDSGDAGFWNPNEDKAVVESDEALQAYEEAGERRECQHILGIESIPHDSSDFVYEAPKEFDKNIEYDWFDFCPRCGKRLKNNRFTAS